MKKKIENFLESIHLLMGLLLGISLGHIVINHNWNWLIGLIPSVIYALWFAKYLIDKSYENNG